MKTIYIDGQKLKNIFKDRGLVPSKVSVEFGLDTAYFTKCFTKNKLSCVVAYTLEQKYNISKNMYTVVEEEPKKEVAELNHIPEEITKQLYRIIYSAVYAAVKKAWSE